MGQYHFTVNLDKKEYLHPHRIGDGLKLLEQGGRGGTNDALHLLLAVSNGRGGGDFPDTDSGREWIGRWGGDRIAIVGDYGEDGDLSPEFRAGSLYNRCYEGEFRDITRDLLPTMEVAYEVVYVFHDGGDMPERFSLFDYVSSTWGGEDGRETRIGDKNATVAQVVEAIRRAALSRPKYSELTTDAVLAQMEA